MEKEAKEIERKLGDMRREAMLFAKKYSSFVTEIQKKLASLESEMDSDMDDILTSHGTIPDWYAASVHVVSEGYQVGRFAAALEELESSAIYLNNKIKTAIKVLEETHGR